MKVFAVRRLALIEKQKPDNVCPIGMYNVRLSFRITGVFSSFLIYFAMADTFSHSFMLFPVWEGLSEALM